MDCWLAQSLQTSWHIDKDQFSLVKLKFPVTRSLQVSSSSPILISQKNSPFREILFSNSLCDPTIYNCFFLWKNTIYCWQKKRNIQLFYMLFTMEDETTKTTQHGHVRLTSFPFQLHSAANTATDSFIVLFYVYVFV